MCAPECARACPAPDALGQPMIVLCAMQPPVLPDTLSDSTLGFPVEIQARTAHACMECEILIEFFSLIFLSTPHLFLVKSMDTYLYINFVDTMGQCTRLYPNKHVLVFITPSPKILHSQECQNPTLSSVVFSIFKFHTHTGAHKRPAHDKLFQAMSRRL